MVNSNPRIGRVIHARDQRQPYTNAMHWLARCGIPLLDASYTDAPIDCMTCLVLEARGG